LRDVRTLHDGLHWFVSSTQQRDGVAMVLRIQFDGSRTVDVTNGSIVIEALQRNAVSWEALALGREESCRPSRRAVGRPCRHGNGRPPHLGGRAGAALRRSGLCAGPDRPAAARPGGRDHRGGIAAFRPSFGLRI
jgi:hypothetical protein